MLFRSQDEDSEEVKEEKDSEEAKEGEDSEEEKQDEDSEKVKEEKDSEEAKEDEVKEEEEEEEEVVIPEEQVVPEEEAVVEEVVEDKIEIKLDVDKEKGSIKLLDKKDQYSEGDKVEFKVDCQAGYEVKKVFLETDDKKELEANDEEIYSFNMPNGRATIIVEFEIVLKDIKITFNPNGGVFLDEEENENIKVIEIKEASNIKDEDFKMISENLFRKIIRQENKFISYDFNGWFKDDQCIEEFDKEITAKELTLNFVGDKKTFLNTDRFLLRFILKQIIDNAIKYSNKGGVVDWLVHTDSDKATISVKDNGVGMKSSRLSTIGTLDGAPYTGTMEEKGAGLSLVIVKDFVEMLGGTMSVSSVEGLGTTVEIKFKVNN